MGVDTLTNIIGPVFGILPTTSPSVLNASDFTSDFEMGNGINFIKLSPTTFQFDVESDPGQTWTADFYVKINQHAKNNAPIIKARNRWGIYVPYIYEHTANVRPIYSYDQVNWFRVPSASYDSVSDVLTFQAPTFTQDTVWLALQFPYHYSTDYASDRARWSSNPLVAFSVIGKSIQNRNIELFTITNSSSTLPESTKKVFYVTGTNHPIEWNAMWRVRGIIEWALSNDPEAIRFRDTSILKATLTKNPDGWVNGYFRTNVAGKDMNRDWQSTGANAALEQPETYAVHHDIDTYAATHPITLFLDSHTGESGDMLFRPVAMPNDASIAALNTILKSLDTPNYIQDSIFDDIFPLTTFSNAMYEQYGSAGSRSFFMENGGLRHNNGNFVTKESAQEVGKIFIKAFFKWLVP
ncbi:MAG: hypothetical protein HYV51_00590 [Parcubacteria group bacterium]|nr:hypothetical protein [Parcubacteria group bacterium]